MRAGVLAARCGCTLRGADVELVGVAHHAQSARPGFLFAALPGQRHHGSEFVAEALARGAVAVLSDRDPGPDVPWLAADNPRRALALTAWELAGRPHERLQMVGVTGTNGKSTVCDLVACIARAAGQRPGVFGTLGFRLPTRSEPTARTTLEASELAPLLAELVEAGGTVAAMEVSSAGLVMERASGLEFDAAVWTNLTRDHLDFHSDMEAYFAAKARLETLLRRKPPGRRVIGIDDPFMVRLAAAPRPGDLRFGFGPEADVTAESVSADGLGLRFRLETPAGSVPVHMRLVGRHNLANALAAAGVGVALGWPLEAIAAGLHEARPLPGRLEPVEVGGGRTVLVDYAHTPDALEKVLLALRELCPARLIAVFGCGGDKDPGKRPLMGEVAGRLADVPIVTSDNPRSEDPLAIIEAVLAGVRRSGNPRGLAIADRREAIAAALAMAGEGDTVLLAGKGHETEQVFADRRIPFDDREVARELGRRRKS
ncbi:MAG TPA: UDP-N-acetylmuramoyl-L-alanyl-D-glutamate--2,6-diaminopimelate ligase [Thermoanaerobaculaceae bacterium]|nr:UDP-N-acetylmuramoyl-L-alanyl-D-glutamate--2,6-diaminopimelate ligase [Thermoanaerobaculaceae bacterium]HRS16348.1 UDP-N-acetylmuramoyl-L-alanyl-D-glutamate--2,6-diaminopimelate ligase [Thermoanaerobaculaceae bacterium]